MRYISIIPARSGSKGIVKKNLKEIQGVPMIVHTFIASKQSRYIERSYVTTDDKEVMKVASEYDVTIPFIRPSSLSGDKSTTADVVIHFLNWYKEVNKSLPDNFILLQPTSPFRDFEDINTAIEKFENTNSKSLLSASKVTQHPFEMFHIDSERKLDFFYKKNNSVNIKVRQNYKNVFFENGAIYICNTDWFLNNKVFFDLNSSVSILSKEHSIDIDEPIDLKLARIVGEG
jgi:CMP-N,N'-diacetyllegionaminic acid synthase